MSPPLFRHLINYMEIKGKHVLVIGTQEPWIEAMVLELGADLVTTLGTNYLMLNVTKHIFKLAIFSRVLEDL